MWGPPVLSKILLTFHCLNKLISKILQILGLQHRISKVFRDHQNIFFSQQVRTILVTKNHIFRGLFISHNCIFIFRNKGEILLFDLVLMFLRKEKSENIPVSTLNIYTVDTLLDQSFRLSIFSKVTNCGCLSVTSVQSVSECKKRYIVFFQYWTVS